ncbi:hypothetical protein [Mesorhizobium amorphae]|uniref:hypothetical protein n=1 Tax=Mesorhizobium amorphae TaxID=71433 RepID=UPI0031F58846
MVAADDTKAIVSITAQALAALFHVPVVVILVLEGKVVSVESLGDLESQHAEIEAARSSLATGLFSRAGVYPSLASRFDFWPLATSKGQGAAIGLAFDPDERPSAPATNVDIVGCFLALALDRQLFRASRDARPKPKGSDR